MKISSKSILTPCRAGVRDPPNSLSRRLRNSGSIKGGASPAMFPTTAKKRGGYENPEPSSPKVTCIGQVRVKSKIKQAKKLRNLEHPNNGFTSTNQNQECSEAQRSWVNFPVTICDALRTFGSEFSCLFPCRTERDKEEKTAAVGKDNGQGGCAVFARWLVAVQDGDGCSRRDIELVVGEEEEDAEEEIVIKKSRRHVFEDLEIINDRIEGHNKDETRVSICIPPKNALLLMRCRSDPMKIEALTNRSWEPNLAKNQEQDEELVDHDDEIENLEVGQHQNMILDQDQENVQQYEANQEQEHENVQKDEVGIDQEESLYLVSLFEEIVNQDYEIQEKESTMAIEFAEISETHEEEMVLGRESEVKEERESERVLPECLLMMMYEPKLSMEVSKETWVCSTDFIKRHSNRRKPPQPPPPVKLDGGDESSVSASVNDVMRVADGGYLPVLPQPGRSSCSLPAAAPSMATMLEQKLADAVGYEPFVLTRCKSEPMKTAAAKLLPESCVWENRKLERLSRVTFAVGAAGLGF